MKKSAPILLLFILSILLISCTHKTVEETPETVEEIPEIIGEEPLTSTIEFMDCENPKTESEIKACQLIADNPNLQLCKQREKADHSFFCISVTTKNPEICENIKEKLTYHLCKAYTNNNPEECDKLEEEKERDLCYADLGMNLQDEELCNKIKNEGKRTTCLAVINSDLKSCFKDEETKEICVINVMEYSQTKISCNDLDKEKREECLKILGGY